MFLLRKEKMAFLCSAMEHYRSCKDQRSLDGIYLQGVIFAIDYSPSTQRICSASDDRSIRVWQLRVDCNWTRVDSTFLHTLFGHTARVWGVRFLLDQLVSVGEVGTALLHLFLMQNRWMSAISVSLAG